MELLKYILCNILLYRTTVTPILQLVKSNEVSVKFSFDLYHSEKKNYWLVIENSSLERIQRFLVFT